MILNKNLYRLAIGVFCCCFVYAEEKFPFLLVEPPQGVAVSGVILIAERSRQLHGTQAYAERLHYWRSLALTQKGQVLVLAKPRAIKWNMGVDNITLRRHLRRLQQSYGLPQTQPMDFIGVGDGAQFAQRWALLHPQLWSRVALIESGILPVTKQAEGVTPLWACIARPAQKPVPVAEIRKIHKALIKQGYQASFHLLAQSDRALFFQQFFDLKVNSQ